jgi:hypothetical protein
MRGCEIKTKAGTFEHRDPGAVLDGTIVSVTVIDKVNSAMRIYHEGDIRSICKHRRGER